MQYAADWLKGTGRLPRKASQRYTKVDAQSDKLATVVGQTKLTTRGTIDVPLGKRSGNIG